MEKIAVFIDNGYFKNVQNALRIRVDYESFTNAIVSQRGGKRWRTYVYDCPPYQSPAPTPDERRLVSNFDRFVSSLKRASRFEVRLGRLQKIRGDESLSARPLYKQKGVDMAMGIDITRLSSKGAIDQAFLIAGDSDFVPAVESAKQEGVLVTLFYSRESHVHDSLFDACDERVPITLELLDSHIRA
jgi:uncharacterized LabA/DUF88 family protein